MGRNAHVLRVALGRNADRPPDWPSLRDQYVALEREDDQTPCLYRGIDWSSRLTFGRLFNEKGQPIDRDARDLDRERCEAQNAVVSIALPDTDGPSKGGTPRSLRLLMKEGDWITLQQTMLAIDCVSLSWLFSIRDRLSMLPSLNRASSLWGAFDLELHTLGHFETFTAGYLRSLIDFLSLNGPLAASIVRLASTTGQSHGFVSTADRDIGPLGLHLAQSGLSLVASVMALHIGPVPTPQRPFPWTRLFWSWNSDQLVAGFTNVLLPAWILCSLRLQIKAFVQRRFNPDVTHPFHVGNYPYSQWISWDSVQQRLLTTRAERSSLVSMKWRHVASLDEGFRKMIATARAACAGILRPSASDTISEFASLTDERSRDVKALCTLPHDFAAGAFAELCQQVVLLPVTGVMSRSLAWLFISPKSPFRAEDTLLSKDDLFPVLPNLADFTPDLGLHTTFSHAGKIALTFVLQAGISATLVGVKSAMVLAILRRKTRGMAAAKRERRVEFQDVD